MAHVAFIGLGRMGHGMAGRYLDAGFTLAVWNRSKAKAEDLIARGARWATSPADAADGADAVVTMVADDAAYTEHVLGGLVFTDEQTVTALERLFDTLRSECYRASESAAIIRKAKPFR